MIPAPGPLWNYRGTVAAIHDGDTLTVLIDLGFEMIYRRSVRLAGINAPEIATPAGIAARDFLRRIVPLGADARMTTERVAEKYGRYLARVLVKRIDGSFFDVSLAMIAAGHAVAYDGGKRT